MQKVSGHCHCGAIRFVAEVDPQSVVVCHCTDCQILSGSPFRVVVRGPAAATHWLEGEAKKYVKTADSGRRRVQAFCGDCGTSLYSSDDVADPEIYAWRLGCLDQREELKPTTQIWCSSALDWALLPALPGVERQS